MRLTTLCLVLRTGIGLGAIAAAAGADLPQLELGRPVEVELGPSDTKSFRLIVNSGEFIEIVSSPDSDLVVRTALFDATGERVAIAPSLGGTGGKALIAAYSKDSAAFRFDIQSQMFRPEKRHCTITLSVRRPASEEDRLDAQAHREFARASALAEKGGPDHLQSAAEALDEPVRLARLAHDSLLEIRALFGKGQFLAMAGKLRDSLPWFEQALPLARALNEQRAEAHLLSVVALVHTNLEENTQALELYQHALTLERAAHQPWETALTLDNLAESESALGRFDLALGYLREEEAIRKELDDELGLNQTRVGLGDLYLSLGDSERAIEALVETLPNWPHLNDREFESTAYNSLGRAYLRLGEHDFAATALQNALRIRQQLGNAKLTGETLIARAQLEALRGDTNAALATYEKALALVRKAGYRHGETLALLGLGDLLDRGHRPRQALERLRPALDIALSIGERYDEAQVRHHLALVDEALGDAAAARRDFDTAFSIQTEIGDRFGQIMCLAGLAKLDRKQGRLEDALRRLDQARELVEFTQSSLLDADLRATYLSSQREIYELSAGLLMELHRKSPSAGYDFRAFDISELAHARALLEALGNARNAIDEGVDPKLLAQARALDAAIHARAADPLGASPVSRSPLSVLLAERNQLELLIHASAPKQPALDQGAPRSIPEIRNSILSDDTILLEYLVSPAKSHLWLVTKTEFRHFDLPAEATLAEAAGRWSASLTERNRIFPNESLAEREARFAAADGTAQTFARELGRMLLPTAVAGLPQTNLVIVADGPLHELPFAALPWPGNNPRTIVSLPSASALARMRERSERDPAAPLLVVADPVYSAEDPRVSSLRSGVLHLSRATLTSGILLRSAHDFGGKPDFPRLRMSRQEAEAIVKLAAPRPSRTLLDFDASAAAFRKPDLDRFGIIHIAAHTMLDNRHADLSGVVLSLVDRQGRAQDGFLRLADIYKLHINADLVTLSACESTLGKGVRGEGLLGLSRGFLYAGANRVLGSLWNVDDRATAVFMENFYRALLAGHLRPPAALRAAQDQLRKDPRWHSPYYWAAFTLQGDWR